MISAARPIHYEDRPSKSFGTASVVAVYPDGREIQVFHGLAPECAHEARRLNEVLVGLASTTAPTARMPG